MARRSEHDILFETVRVGSKTLRNRFYQTPHCTGFGTEKPHTQALHRGVKAEGGWAVVCTEYCSISPESEDSPFVSATLWDDDDVRALALTVDEAHRHGALAGVQLWHGGYDVENRGSRLPPLSPSGLPVMTNSSRVTRAMDRDDIRRVQGDWVAAAHRARSAGFDLLYVFGSHGYLPTQFLSERTNLRTDSYGGSFENRARFWLETIELVREAVGDDLAVAVRIAADTLDLSGVTREEGAAFMRAADHLVDLWDLSIGVAAGPGRLDSGPSRFTAQGYQREWTAPLREATAKPIVGVGRYTDPDLMAEVIRSGVQDLIGAARPSIADPFLPSKIEAGRYEDIRPCIGCNACYSRANYSRHLGCTQNPTAGEEYRRSWHPERVPQGENLDRSILIVGAGPAGLECGLTLARRGFPRIEIVDAADRAGGCVDLLRRLPGLAEWGWLVDYRLRQLARLGVPVRLETRMDADAVRAAGAELVVLATGSRWALDGRNGIDHGALPGADAVRPDVMTPEQIVREGKRPPDRRAVVIDYDGYLVGACVAELLATEGYEVTIVTPHSVVSPVADEMLEGIPARRRLAGLGVAAVREASVARVEPGSVHLRGGQVIAVDGVVLVTQRVPVDDLHGELASDTARLAAAGITRLLRAGDCIAPRLLPDAVFDGHRLARELDEPRPLPYRRERMVTRSP